MVDLDGVASELYRLPPSEFTAARNARAKEIASAGDRELARQTRRLPKTSAAVWALNQLASDTQVAEELRDLGTRLRHAQVNADRAQLDLLVKKRRSLLNRATTAVLALAGHSNIQLSSTGLIEIEQSLGAALADEDAAIAVLSGRLVKPLQSDGLEPVDLAGATEGTPVLTRRAHATTEGANPSASSNAPRPDAASVTRTRKTANEADAALKVLEQQQAKLDRARTELEHDAGVLQAQLVVMQKRRDELDDRSTRIARDARSALDASRKAHSALDQATRRS